MIKKILSLVLMFSMLLTCCTDISNAIVKKKKESKDTYLISIEDQKQYANIKTILKKQNKVVKRHTAEDEKYLESTNGITVELTSEEADDLQQDGVYVEKDKTVYACDKTEMVVPEEMRLDIEKIITKNQPKEQQEINCKAEKPKDSLKTQKEFIDDPQKFRPCKAIRDPKKKNEVVPWNVACVAGTPHENKYRGKGVKVAIIDSGIDVHNELNTKKWVDFSDTVNGYKPTDSSGHGTQVAGVIAARINGLGMEGIADQAQLYSVKVLDENNKASISAVTKAIEWCIQNDIDIINMSFGTDEYSQILHDEIKKAKMHNIVMVAAAGNNKKQIQYPAAYSEVISVGSIDEQLCQSAFSDNKNVDLVAPGENVQTLGYLGSFSTTEGTSIATAHVTGIAAAIMSMKSNKNQIDIKKILKDSAVSLADGSRLVNYQNAIMTVKNRKDNMYQKEAYVHDIAETMASNEKTFVEGSWNSYSWQGIDGTGHFTIINKMPLSCFGKQNESDTEKTYHRWIAARASYLTDNLEWLSGSHVLGKANRNDAGEIVMDGQEFKPPYHASSTYSINEVVSSHLQFLYELARRRIVLGSKLDLVATNYSGNTYYKVGISRKMKRRIIVDLRAVHEHTSVYFQNYPIDMNTAINQGYMVLGVFLHLVGDIQAHRAQIKFDMLFAKSDGMIYYGYDNFAASAGESRINGLNIIGMPNNFDTYWELYNLLKQGPIPMIRLQARLKDSFTIGYNGQQYNCTKASAYEDNPYFYSDRFDTACWFSWAYIDRMNRDTGNYSTQTGYFYADGRVPLC